MLFIKTMIIIIIISLKPTEQLDKMHQETKSVDGYQAIYPIWFDIHHPNFMDKVTFSGLTFCQIAV